MGIHLCGAVLRRAELRRVGSRVEIVTVEQLLPEQRTAAPPDAVADSTENGAPRRIASLPTSEVLSRCWSLPDAEGGKFRQMVAHRLEADLPIPMDQLIWGYRAGGRRSSADGRRQVFAQAARTEPIAKYLATLSAAGLMVDTLTTEAEAIGALYRHGLKHREIDGPEVLVLATADAWLVAVLGDGLVQSLRRLDVDPDRTELTCRRCQQAIEGQVPRHELRRVLWCASEEQAQARAALAQQMRVTVEAVEPAGRLVNPDGVPLDPEQLANFGPAIGLALAGEFEADQFIRLASQEQTREKTHSRLLQWIVAHPRRWTASAAALLVLAVVLHIGALSLETRKMKALLDDMGPDGAPMAALHPKVQAMQRLETYRIDVESIVADLCRPVPDTIVISSIQLSRDRRLLIKGKSKDPKAIFALADALRKGDRFTAVNPEGTEPEGGFTISAELVGVQVFPSAAGGVPWR